MVDVNVDTDLAQISQQLEQLIGQLNQLNLQRDKLTQQIHNLNGIVMYLRGKSTPIDGPVEVSDNNTSEKAIKSKDS